MQKIYSHIGQILVEVGLVVGFIFGVLVALILIGSKGNQKESRLILFIYTPVVQKAIYGNT